MNPLQLLFDPQTGSDSLGDCASLLLSAKVLERLSRDHYVRDVAVLPCAEKTRDTSSKTPDHNASPKMPDTTSTLFVQNTEGWLTLSASWLDPVYLCPIETENIGVVAAELQARHQRLSEFLYNLHELSRTSSNVGSLLTLTQKFCGFALVLFDESFNLVSYSLGNTLLTQAFRETVERGYAAGVPENHQRSYWNCLEGQSEGFEVLLEEVERSTPIWVVPIQTSKHHNYFLHVMLGQEHFYGLRAIIKELTRELAFLLDRRTDTQTQTNDTTFVAALMTQHFTETSANERVSFLGWKLAHHYVAFRVESFEMNHPDAQFEIFCSNLRHLAKGLKAAVVSHGIAGLVALENREEKSALSLPAIKEFLANQQLIMVISSPTETLNSLFDIHRDLCRALEVLWQNSSTNGRHPVEPIVTYDDCKLLLLKDALRREAEEHAVIPDLLSAIEAYDLAHGTELGRTLQSYAVHFGGKTNTCSKLAIHRSTLEYRLDRLRQLFGVDFEDEQLFTHLRLLSLANA